MLTLTQLWTLLSLQLEALGGAAVGTGSREREAGVNPSQPPLCFLKKFECLGQELESDPILKGTPTRASWKTLYNFSGDQSEEAFILLSARDPLTL